MPPNNEKLFNRAKSRAKKSDEIENYIEISSESEFENEPEEEQCDSNIYTCERIIKMKCKYVFLLYLINILLLLLT
jgi:hypothetical protein